MDDLISRQSAIDAILSVGHIAELSDGDAVIRVSAVNYVLRNLPSAQPELHYDEWCNSCKEYDKEKHFCPRFNRVIKNTVDELKSAQSEIICCGECAKMQVDSIYHDCWCKETGKKVFVDHYCGYAERKENERKD